MVRSYATVRQEILTGVSCFPNLLKGVKQVSNDELEERSESVDDESSELFPLVEKKCCMQRQTSTVSYEKFAGKHRVRAMPADPFSCKRLQYQFNGKQAPPSFMLQVTQAAFNFRLSKYICPPCAKVNLFSFIPCFTHSLPFSTQTHHFFSIEFTDSFISWRTRLVLGTMFRGSLILSTISTGRARIFNMVQVQSFFTSQVNEWCCAGIQQRTTGVYLRTVDTCLKTSAQAQSEMDTKGYFGYLASPPRVSAYSIELILHSVRLSLSCFTIASRSQKEAST